MASPYKELLDATRWSFSRLRSYEECPAAFKKIYLDKCDKDNNAFAEWGSLCHSILEDFAKGNLMEYEMEDAYNERYDEYMHHEFPPSRGRPMAEKYYTCGVEYFSAFEGFPETWEVLGVEVEIDTKIAEHQLIGFIDLLVRDSDGGLIVIDHKSKAGFKSDAEQAAYAIQLYLYAKWVYETYGEYPKELMFNMFREGTEVIIPFNYDDYLAAQSWASQLIESIYEDVDFWDKIYLKYSANDKDISEYKCNDFFCRNLCSCKIYCERSGYGGVE